MTLLDIVLFLPLVGFLLLLILPKESSRMAAMVLSSVIFVVSLGLLMPYWFQYPGVTPSAPTSSGSAIRRSVTTWRSTA